MVAGLAPAWGAAPPMREAFVQAGLSRAARLEKEAAQQAEAGRFAEALRLDREALAVRRRWLPEKHHLVQESMLDVERWGRLAKLPEGKQQQLGTALRWEGESGRLRQQARYAEAEKADRQALGIKRKVLGEEHPDTAASYNNLAGNLNAQAKYAQAQPLYEKALAIRRQALGDGHPDTAQSYNNVAFNLKAQGKYAQAQPLYEKALAIRRQALGENHPDTAISYNNVALNLNAQGKYAQAQPLLEKALAIFRKGLGEEHPHTAHCSNNVAFNLIAQGKYAQAQPLLEKALAIRRQALGENHPDTAQSYNGVAVNLNAQGKYAQAQPLYEKALAIWRQALGEGHPVTAHCYNNLAINLNAQGKYAQAQPLYEKALAIRRQALGEEHPDTAASYNNVAHNLNAQGKHAQARPLYEKALAIRRQALGEEHPVTAQSYNNVAHNLNAQGKYAQARPLCEKALAINRQALGENHPDTAQSYNGVAVNLNAQGKYAQAQPLYEKALAIRRKVLGEEHPYTATSYNNLAINLDAQGKYAQARSLCEKALAIWRQALGEGHPDTALGYYNLAINLNAQGRYAQAQPLYEKALAIWRQALGEEHPHTAHCYNNVAGNLWKLERRHEAVRLWQLALASHETSRGLATSAGFDRATFAGSRFSTQVALAVGLARLGYPRSAWRHAEADLARGLLDDIGGADPSLAEAAHLRALARSLDARLLPLLTRRDLPDEQRRLREQLLRQSRQVNHQLARLSAEASARHLLPLAEVQRQVPADAALVLWLDVPDLGEHWACIVRRAADPIWQELPGTGPGRSHTEADLELPRQVYLALVASSLSAKQRDEVLAAVPAKSRPFLLQAFDPAQRDRLIAALHRQRLAPLERHLKATTTMPAVRRLLVVPTGEMARVPVEVLTEAYAVSYVPSGSFQARLRKGPRPLSASPLLALADPVFTPREVRPPGPPGHGLLLAAVVPGGNAARAGLRSGDVLLRYGDRRLDSLDDLKKAIGTARAAASAWRDGRTFEVRLDGGPLGVSLDRRPAPEAVRERRRIDTLLAQRGSGHRPLPGTRVEAEAICRLVPFSTRLFGSMASEQQLDRLNAAGGLRRYRVLHLATHGEVNPGRPELSALILAQDRLPDRLQQQKRKQKVYDGRLTVGTIARDWDLDADLVVLSACETGLGQKAGGEGLLGFAHAFLSRGARGVVLSRWKVDDTATALLMVRFYENLLGKRKGLEAPLGRAEALGEAKRWVRGLPRKEAGELAARLTGGVLRGTVEDIPPPAAKAPPLPAGDRPFAPPYYWAAFVLVGDPD
jgi:tetratricopeptide (TPR) repeat protein